ncbi:hypothetical protein VM1G_11207 [Cytospora mali]|uniref:Uncharacterized protein n=1 Tax=Cytospora mali TaxID=578113 RepID=A0A194VKC7_CYTMA|nr:hypothetical protein VM1G_11207 [Valsa mali]
MLIKPMKNIMNKISRRKQQVKAKRRHKMATKSTSTDEQSKSTLSIFINDFTDSDNEASAEVWAWFLEQNPKVKGIYIAEPRWVNLGYYMTSEEFGKCIGIVSKLESRIDGSRLGDPPLTIVLAGRMTEDIINDSHVKYRDKDEDSWRVRELEDYEKGLLRRCIKPKRGGKDDSLNHARLVALDYMTTMRARCTRFNAYLDIHCLEDLEDPINLKTHYHEELVARTAKELDEFRKISAMSTGNNGAIEDRRNRLREWYSGAIDRKKRELGNECILEDLKYEHLIDEIRTHDKTIAFGGASLTALQNILSRDEDKSLGKKIHYYQQGGTFDSKLNILGNPYNFALNTKAAEYVFLHSGRLASFKLIPTDTTKKIEWTTTGLAQISPAVGVRSVAFHGRYDPWDMISEEEREPPIEQTEEFMALRSKWVSNSKYSEPGSKGYKAVMADLTAFLAAFTEAFKEYKTEDHGIVKQDSIRATMVTVDNQQRVLQTLKNDQSALQEVDKIPSTIECLVLVLPSGQEEAVLVKNALELVKSALERMTI